jgi:hypothetical protein
MYEIFFKYDDSWNAMEILALMQTIQRILGLEEKLVVKRTESGEVTIPVQISSDDEAQKLLDRIHETVIMVEPYKIEYRRLENA